MKGRYYPMNKNLKMVLCALAIAALCVAAAFIYLKVSTPSYKDVPNPQVTITMENGEEIHLELYPDVAPITAANFVDLANSGYYDGLIFHRVIPGFMIQGGDPAGTGAGGPDYCIKGEFSQNGFENNLAHTPGVLSMARTMFPDSAGSQFFIMHKAAPHLDGAYAAFGKVTEGLEVVDKIASVNTDYSDKPLQPQRMATVTVETFGVEYPEPEKC